MSANKVSKTVTVVNKLGIHARPASMFVRTASKFSAEILVEKDGEKVNGKSIMGVLMLAAAKGTVLTARVVGPEETVLKEMLDQVEELVNGKFGEGR